MTDDGVGNDNGTCEANETCLQAVTCPGDAIVLNGGFRVVDRGSVVIASYPGLFNEWDVFLTNDGKVDDFVVVAHCLNQVSRIVGSRAFRPALAPE